MSSLIMHFYYDDNPLLLQKFELEDFSKNRLQTIFKLFIVAQKINKQEIIIL